MPAAAEVLRKTLGTQPVHRAESAAESARLKTADVVAEARERIGEEASPPRLRLLDYVDCRQGRRARPLSTTTDRLT
ncbi:DUF1490 family protein [Mycobacterium intracellulare]|uniref:DUF1490 family protein n=1 Tax=Mycobacterium intracellulare TaxID=1767 RepID=UPI003556E840